MIQIEEHYPLARLTTFGIGGIARKYAAPQSAESLIDVLTLAKSENAPVFILGAGSNTLINDEGFEGYVIHPAMKSVEWKEHADGSVLVTIDAGASFDDVVCESCRRNLGGIESLSGIPGSAGGSLVQNIGAYGQEISESFVRARAIRLDNLEICDMSREDMAFSYRHTSLKTASPSHVIVSVTLRLQPYDVDAASERCIAHGFKQIALRRPQTAMALRELVIETRRSKAMCYDPADYNTHGVGSFFVNPTVSNEDAQRLNAASAIRYQKSIPCYPTDDGRMKLSAAWLIEKAGFNKGYCYKGVSLSEKHCLAIVNRKNATAADIIEFANGIASYVYMAFRIELQPEVVYLAQNSVAPLPIHPRDAEVTGTPLRPNSHLYQ